MSQAEGKTVAYCVRAAQTNSLSKMPQRDSGPTEPDGEAGSAPVGPVVFDIDEGMFAAEAIGDARESQSVKDGRRFVKRLLLHDSCGISTDTGGGGIDGLLLIGPIAQKRTDIARQTRNALRVRRRSGF